MEDFSRGYHQDLLTEKREALHQLHEGGFLFIRDNTLMPTRAGLAVADRLALI
ncbi:MAG: hypothetical protein EHM36_00630 [Deltaproteobacteria bacterium]|nr:MAG: hypothetical protein EHM36_00630 [Deltaproteobacteria bacterium]